MKKFLTKLVATITIMTIAFSNLSIIGIYGSEVFASELDSQNTNTNINDVNFDAYFKQNDKNTHDARIALGADNKLYYKITVGSSGYLKNAKITLKGEEKEENANLEMGEIAENSVIQNIDKQKREITFNQINANTEKEIEIPISFINSENINVKDFSKQNVAKLEATFIDINGKEHKVQKEIKVKLNWYAETVEANIEQNISKYIPFNINSKKGIIIQTVLKSGIKDNKLPVKETNITVKVPSINNIKPSEVRVEALSTKATNGEETGNSFKQENYNYDSEKSEIKIKVNNSQEETNISWKKQAQDEYIITYIYNEEALNSITEEGIVIPLEAKADISVYTQNNVIAEAKTQNQLKEKLNDVVTLESNMTSNISKAYMYANTKPSILEENKKETIYEENYALDVSYSELVDKMQLNIQAPNFKNNKEKQTPTSTNTYLKNITINKKQINNILGEEGKITIKTKEGTVIAEITKDSTEIAYGLSQVELSELNINELVVETTKPQKEGKIDIKAQRAIKTTASYTKEQIAEFTQLQATAQIISTLGETTVVDTTKTMQSNLEEQQMSANLSTDRNVLSTITENKNVILTAVLNTNNLSNKLYTNPRIEITLPEYVENISINKTPEIAFNTELAIEKHEIVTREDGRKVIVINLKGEQTKYDLGLVSGGANIIIDANMTLKRLTPTAQTEIIMNVINNANEKTVQEILEVKSPITTQSPTGTITINKMTDFNIVKDVIETYNGENNEGKLDVFSQSKKQANIEMTIMNNNGKALNNVAILGRTIAKGNTNPGTGEDLGTTFDTVMKAPLQVNGLANYKAYYSENEKATKDLSKAENGWTETPADFSKIKSFLIVPDSSYIMQVGNIITASYASEIPENLGRNSNGNTTYAIYSTLEGATSEDKTVAPTVKLSTGEGPELSVKLESNVEGKEVREGQNIHYKVTVTNTGKVDAKGVIVAVDIPKYTTFIEYVPGVGGEIDEYTPNEEKTKATKAFDNIKVGETATYEFDVRVNTMELTDEEEENDQTIDTVERIVKAQAYAISEGIETKILSNELTNKVLKGYVAISLVTSPGVNSQLIGGETLTYILNVENMNEDLKQNIVVKSIIPDGLIYKNAYIEKHGEYFYDKDTYDENTKEVTFNIGKLSALETAEVYLQAKVDGTKYGMTKISNNMSLSGKTSNNETFSMQSNTVENKIKIRKPSLSGYLTSNIPNNWEVEEGNIVEYTLQLENTGDQLIQGINIEGILPEGLRYLSSKYKIDGIESVLGGGTDTENGEPIKLSINLLPSQILQYTITAKVEDLKEGVNEKEVSYSFKIIHDEIEDITTNEITYKIVKSGSTDNGQEGGDLTGNKRIQGVVWLDTNSNGKNDQDEEKMSGVTVLLFNNDTGDLVKDGNGEKVTAITDENGQYTFKALKPGNYTVVFKYDTSKYSATEYKKAEISEIENSDAIDAEVTIDGVKFIAGVTEKITVEDENIYNINLGLVAHKKFDLKLEQKVSNITVQNPTGTAKYPYDINFAKRELIGKYIEQTTIVVEYKIAVKNEGEIDGYVKKIVDYLPSNLKFNAELNKDWYTAENGAIYNSSLSNIKIAPGESKEVTLYLTKTLQESDLGTPITNTAEIYEDYNELGIKDIDSVPGNKVSEEDDISSANVILSVRTGSETVLFIGLTLAILAIIGTGAYFIYKKVLRKI